MGCTVRWRRLSAAWLILSLFQGCLDSKPKTLGSNRKLDFSSSDSGTQNSFKFNFAKPVGPIYYCSSRHKYNFITGQPDISMDTVGAGQ